LENVDIFYNHWEYFTDIRDILCPFGILCTRLVHFSGFGIMYREKSGNPVQKLVWKKSAQFFYPRKKTFQHNYDSIVFVDNKVKKTATISGRFW
jgi:hypothetical protein